MKKIIPTRFFIRTKYIRT